MATRIFVVQVEARKDIADLGDIIANRAYTIDGIEDARATELLEVDVDGGEPTDEIEMVEDWPDTFLERLGRAIDGFIDGWRGY